jgi:hypothetical protein
MLSLSMAALSHRKPASAIICTCVKLSLNIYEGRWMGVLDS